MKNFGENAFTTLRNTYFKPFYLFTYTSVGEGVKPSLEDSHPGLPALSPLKLISLCGRILHSSVPSKHCKIAH